MPYKSKEDRNRYQRNWRRKLRAKDPEADKERRRRYRNNTRERLKLLLDNFRKDGCYICKEMEECTLTAHHKNPSEKEDHIANLFSQNVSVKRFKKELEKCICLCFNCHHKLHAGKIEESLASRLLERQPVS